MRPYLVLAMLLLATAAQGSAQLPQGARVRVTVADPRPHTRVGTFETRTDSALVLTVATSSQTFPLRSITRVQMSQGKRASLAGGIVGLIAGVAAGSLIACDSNRDSYGVFCGGQNDTKVVLGAAIGGIGGAALGAFLFRRESWTDLDRW